jgi:predicted transposase/invertase (TIGR01784 family)
LDLQERYVNPLTDFGFKRLFGTELNKILLIDFLNVLLPERHQIEDLTYGNSEQVGNTPIDRKAIFDIYCQGVRGDRFIVEIQKAKQDYFKDCSVYYASFPIQEQGQKGNWNDKLAPVYGVGVLDFIFDDHKDDPTLLHTVELKNQRCEVFYDKLKFIYVELPKFNKTVEELETRFDQWLFLLKHLPDLDNPPPGIDGEVFRLLFEIAELANFSRQEQQAYESSLKYYRDLKNVIDSAERGGVAKGMATGIATGITQGISQGQRSLLLTLLSHKLGELPEDVQDQIEQLPTDSLEGLGKAIFELENVEALRQWLLELSCNKLQNP